MPSVQTQRHKDSVRRGGLLDTTAKGSRGAGVFAHPEAVDIILVHNSLSVCIARGIKPRTCGEVAQRRCDRRRDVLTTTVKACTSVYSTGCRPSTADGPVVRIRCRVVRTER